MFFLPNRVQRQDEVGVDSFSVRVVLEKRFQPFEKKQDLLVEKLAGGVVDIGEFPGLDCALVRGDGDPQLSVSSRRPCMNPDSKDCLGVRGRIE